MNKLRLYLFLIIVLLNFGQLNAGSEIHSNIKTFKTEELEKLRHNPKYQYTVSSKIPTDSFLGRILFRIVEFIRSISPSSGTFDMMIMVVIVTILIIFILTIIFRAKYAESQPNDQNIETFNERIGIPIRSTPEEMLAKALADQDYRSAFRWQFIIYLKKTHLAGYISLSPEKTNYDYIKEYSNKPGNKSFRKVCLVYDYIWYGHKDVDESKYYALNSLFNLSRDEV